MPATPSQAALRTRRVDLAVKTTDDCRRMRGQAPHVVWTRVALCPAAGALMSGNNADEDLLDAQEYSRVIRIALRRDVACLEGCTLENNSSLAVLGELGWGGPMHGNRKHAHRLQTSWPFDRCGRWCLHTWAGINTLEASIYSRPSHLSTRFACPIGLEAHLATVCSMLSRQVEKLAGSPSWQRGTAGHQG